jgi:hypothetical protein
MTLHRNVLIDLALLVASGRASPESRTLVREMAEHDPQLASLAAEDSRLRALELRALAATRQRLSHRSWLMGIAIFFTLLPFSVMGDEHGVRFLFAAWPGMQMMSLVVALGAWAGWWRIGRSVFADTPQA